MQGKYPHTHAPPLRTDHRRVIHAKNGPLTSFPFLLLTNAQVIHGQVAVIHATVAKLGADVAHADARQRQVVLHAPDLNLREDWQYVLELGLLQGCTLCV